MIAFLVSPLAVPLLTIWYLRPPIADPAFGIVLFVSTLVAYAGALVFGVPLYRCLRTRRLTAFWIAPTTGFAAGTAMMFVFSAFLGLFLGHGTSSIGSKLFHPDLFLDSVRFGGVAGAAVGIILWLIARPDRGPQSTEPSES